MGTARVSTCGTTAVATLDNGRGMPWHHEARCGGLTVEFTREIFRMAKSMETAHSNGLTEDLTAASGARGNNMARRWRARLEVSRGRVIGKMANLLTGLAPPWRGALLLATRRRARLLGSRP